MYILKIKGSAKIPDYIQIRDENFMLIAYFRADHWDLGIDRCGLSERKSEIENIIYEIPYGKIFKLP